MCDTLLLGKSLCGLHFLPGFRAPICARELGRFGRPLWSPSETPYLFGRAPDRAHPCPGLSLLGAASARTEAKRLGDKSAPGPAKTDSPGPFGGPHFVPRFRAPLQLPFPHVGPFSFPNSGREIGATKWPRRLVFGVPWCVFVTQPLRFCLRRGGAQHGQARAGVGPIRGPAEKVGGLTRRPARAPETTQFSGTNGGPKSGQKMEPTKGLSQQ